MTTSRSTRRLVPAFVLLFALSSCSLSGPPNPFRGGPQGERTVAVDVRNNNFSDATIYVFRGGERIRAGVVTGKDRRTFRIPWTVNRSFQVGIDLLGGGTCMTREFTVDAGDQVQIDVPVDISTDPECRPR
jgi:hypothetical protein